jgi:hypothetical protein
MKTNNLFLSILLVMSGAAIASGGDPLGMTVLPLMD